uniref:probable bifunctional dTTP/UTP pyrophosphatase/methyltransferase protein n=1 Tax=Jaculus jaculus TaxID=51337 RepID=UPI001E1B330F|nr:probable bifunctional dTTP/UTP pyrophosphatase/methyltransferase protein [Jaculus jaculus]
MALRPVIPRLQGQRVVLASASPRRQEILRNAGLRFEVIPSRFRETLDKASFPDPPAYAVETARHKALEVAHRLHQKDQRAPDLVIAADTIMLSRRFPRRRASIVPPPASRNVPETALASSRRPPPGMFRNSVLGALPRAACQTPARPPAPSVSQSPRAPAGPPNDPTFRNVPGHRGTFRKFPQAVDGLILEKPAGEQDAFRMLSRLSGKEHSVFTGVAVLRCWNEEGGGLRARGAEFSEETRVTFSELSPELLWDYVRSGEPMDKAGGYGIQALGGMLVERVSGDFLNVVGFPLNRFCRELDRLLPEGDGGGHDARGPDATTPPPPEGLLQLADGRKASWALFSAFRMKVVDDRRR